MKRPGNVFYFLPSLTGIDLILIALGMNNSNISKVDTVYSISDSTILSIDDIYKLLDKNLVFTAVGYPGKGFSLSERTPEYIWGDYLGIVGDYITLNVPAQPGNSGSPVLVRKNQSYYFIGIVAKVDTVKKISYAIPSSYIKECFKKFFEYIDKR